MNRPFSSRVIATFVAAIGSTFLTTAARAENIDTVMARVQLLEKEIAAIKKENDALRQIKRLREENASLATHRPIATLTPNVTQSRPVIPDPREAYASTAPIVKAIPHAQQGVFKIWGEGGAAWSGGDPISSFYKQHVVVQGGGNLLGEPAPGSFALMPTFGWEAAGGFDYRFSNSDWHVSGQFRYGEGETTASAFHADTTVRVPPDVPSTYSVRNNMAARHRETHWLADLALGRDVVGAGADAMQVKFGLRVAELQAAANVSNDSTRVLNLASTTTGTFDGYYSSTFFGAGPRIGIDGSIPLGERWAFDYLGDAAVLFGVQKNQLAINETIAFSSSPGVVFPTSSPPELVRKFATVFNADIQLGASYWMTDTMKLSASYRLDAYFNVFDTAETSYSLNNLRKVNRYIHGPRLAVAAQF